MFVQIPINVRPSYAIKAKEQNPETKTVMIQRQLNEQLKYLYIYAPKLSGCPLIFITEIKMLVLLLFLSLLPSLGKDRL